MSDRTGQQFGSYHLIRLLGRGGFAEVYLGEHIHMQTQAAIKVLSTHLITKDLERFLQEARTIVSLEHPHIVRVFDFGIEQEIPFLVMSYAPYGTLRQRHPQESCVPLDDTLSYVKQIALALQYAHDRKVIHRDIKPENMLVGNQGELLLSDFGIAVTTSTSTSQQTRTTAGTVAYMAPEQILGKPCVASDQYALGIIVYEWLCGDQPFQGSFFEMCAQHLHAPFPSLQAKNPAIPFGIEQCVTKALSKDPEQRFACIQDFATALQESTQQAVYHLTSIAAQNDITLLKAKPAVSASLDTNQDDITFLKAEPKALVLPDPSRENPPSPTSNTSKEYTYRRYAEPPQGTSASLNPHPHLFQPPSTGFHTKTRLATPAPLRPGQRHSPPLKKGLGPTVYVPTQPFLTTPSVPLPPLARYNPKRSPAKKSGSRLSKSIVMLACFAILASLIVASFLSPFLNKELKDVLARVKDSATLTRPRDQGPTDPRDQGPTDPRDQGPTDPRDQGQTDPRDQGQTDPRDQGPTDPRDQGQTDPAGGPTDPPTPPCLTVNPSTLSFTKTKGSTPPSKNVTITNGKDCGGGSWSASGDTWILISPQNGHIDAGDSVTVSVGITSTLNTVGTYSGTISFKAGSSTPQVTVNAQVKLPPCPVKKVSHTPVTIPYIPPHTSGDADFEDHGPQVEVTVTPTINTSTITVRVAMTAAEKQSDWTTARGAATYTAYTAPSGWTIQSAPGVRSYSYAYTDTDHSVDYVYFAQPAGGEGFISQFDITGDTKGDEAGTKTGVKVHFRQFKIQLVQMGECE